MIRDLDISRFRKVLFEEESSSCRVSAAEMSGFGDQNVKLAKLIGKRKLRIESGSFNERQAAMTKDHFLDGTMAQFDVREW